MSYGTKAATLIKRNRLSVSKYEKTILKEIMECCRDSPKTSSVTEMLSGKTISKRIKAGRIRYFCHLMRRPANHPLRLALRFSLKKKKVGRPSLTWNDNVLQDLALFRNMNINDWMKLSKEEVKRKTEEIYDMEDSVEETTDEDNV